MIFLALILAIGAPSFSEAAEQEGRYLVGVSSGNSMLSSVDFGLSFITSNGGTIYSLAAAAKGQRLAALFVGGTVQISSDFGATWNRSRLLPGTWTAVAMCETGQFVTVVGTGGAISASMNAGATWMDASVDLHSMMFSKVAITANGKIQFAAGNSKTMFVSHDYGSSWSPLTTPFNVTPGTVNANLIFALASSTGEVITTLSASGGVFTSNNSGLTWTQATVPVPSSIQTSAWSAVTMSWSGQYQLVVSSPIPSAALIAFSSDYGQTWAPQTLDVDAYACVGYSLTIQAVAISSTGLVQTLAGTCQGFAILFNSLDRGATWTQPVNCPASVASLISLG